jgi:peptidoglycan/xylan/chitin deacetylase (PgdA/CDA1 family)
MRSDVKHAVATLGYRLGVTQAAARLGDRWRLDARKHGFTIRRKRGGTFLVLTYHRVHEPLTGFTIDTVAPAVFEAQMRYAAAHFTIRSLGELAAQTEAGEQLPPRALAITFDDGYVDNHHYAFPILARLGLPWTLFVTAGCIETRERLWFDRVLRAFQTTARAGFDLPELGPPAPLTTVVERQAAAYRVLGRLKGLAAAARLEAVDRITEALEVTDEDAEVPELLTWAQIREMAEAGVAIGSHTLTHPILSRVPLAEAWREIAESKWLIERRIGRVVTLFAYPNGKADDLTDETITMIRQAGYRTAVTTELGANGPGQHPLTLRRIKPWGPSTPLLALGLTYHHLVPEVAA